MNQKVGGNPPAYWNQVRQFSQAFRLDFYSRFQFGTLLNFSEMKFRKCILCNSSRIFKFLAGRDQKWPVFWSFGVTHLHLPRGRVPESLWKPHQSKAINFLHRSCVPTFFPTPTQKYFFSRSKKKSKFFSAKNIFRGFSRKSKILSDFHFFSEFRVSGTGQEKIQRKYTKN